MDIETGDEWEEPSLIEEEWDEDQALLPVRKDWLRKPLAWVIAGGLGVATFSGTFLQLRASSGIEAAQLELLLGPPPSLDSELSRTEAILETEQGKLREIKPRAEALAGEVQRLGRDLTPKQEKISALQTRESALKLAIEQAELFLRDNQGEDNVGKRVATADAATRIILDENKLLEKTIAAIREKIGAIKAEEEAIGALIVRLNERDTQGAIDFEERIRGMGPPPVSQLVNPAQDLLKAESERQKGIEPAMIFLNARIAELKRQDAALRSRMKTFQDYVRENL